MSPAIFVFEAENIPEAVTIGGLGICKTVRSSIYIILGTRLARMSVELYEGSSRHVQDWVMLMV